MCQPVSLSERMLQSRLYLLQLEERHAHCACGWVTERERERNLEPCLHFCLFGSAVHGCCQDFKTDVEKRVLGKSL